MMKKKNSILTQFLLLLVFVFGLFPITPLTANSDAFYSDENQEARQEQIEVSGTVTDAQNDEPLPGVNIVVEGTTIGTTTDMDGNYSIEAPSDATLAFTFVGYQKQTVKINGQQEINVTLEQEATELEEVVAVGYGTQEKESVVGSISQTSSEDFERITHGDDLKESLEGEITGMAAITSTGEPGGVQRGESATQFFIRGQTTWNNAQPLILVDGVEREMMNINPDEVESISVLKDASATAVFGVQGANGVVMIKTKRGSEGEMNLSFDYTTTGKTLSKLPETMESYSAIMARNKAIERETVLNEPSWKDYIPHDRALKYKKPQTEQEAFVYPNVDWEDAAFKDFGLSHRANLSARGGTEFVNYFASLGYLNEGDMFRDYDNHKGYDASYGFNRFNFRSNLDFKLSETTTFKVNLSGYYSKKNTNWSNEGSTSAANQWMWNAVYGMPPDIYQPRYDDDRWGWSHESMTVNPVAAMNNLGVRETRTTELRSDLKLEQKLDFILEGLSANVSFYYDNNIISEGGIWDVANSVRPEDDDNVPYKIVYPDRYEGPDQPEEEYVENQPRSGVNQFDWVVRPWNIEGEEIAPGMWQSWIPITRSKTYEGQLNYDRSFGPHNVTAMGVFKRSEYARGNMFPKYREDWIFRATYNYERKYLFEMNGAYNGSEQFGPGYKFDFFPSLAVGWDVSRENFFNLDWVSRMKFRYSTGLAGDDNVAGGRWLYESQLDHGGSARISGGNVWSTSPYTWYSEEVVGNPNVRWEKVLKNNYGLELNFFDNKFNLNFDYYTEHREDVLISGGQRSVPPFFGMDPPPANLGEVKSWGYEMELEYKNRVNDDFSYWTEFTLAHNDNEVIFRDDPPLMADYKKDEGYPIGQTRTKVRTGFYNNWDEVYASVPTENNDGDKLPGYYNLLDFDGDGVITNEGDIVPYGYTEIPQNTYNFSLGANYKGFGASVQIYARNNASRSVYLNTFDGNLNTVYDHVSDYWSKDNQNASSFLPRWKTSGQNIGDYFIYDASYIRLKNVELSYSFDQQNLKGTGMSNLRMFVSGRNLYFHSDLPDDRESARQGGGASSGTYPTVKRINFGVELGF